MPLFKHASLILAMMLLGLSPYVLAGSYEHHRGDAPKKSEQSPQPETPSPQSIQLTPALLALLNEEMGLIQQGMMNLIPATAAGKWDQVADLGKKIKASFILKQALTASQKEELRRVLPERFIEMDRDFHQAAGLLAHAAEMKNADLVNFYFYQMNTACVSCHGRYAPQRFPGLKEQDGEAHRY